MVLILPAAAKPVLFLLSLALAALLLVPNVRSYSAHRLGLGAEEHLSWGRLEAAATSLQRAVERTPGDAERYRELGELEASRYRWRNLPAAQDAALAAYATAVSLNPADGNNHAAYAEALLSAERFSAAHEALAEALERDPNNAVYHTLRGRLAEAEGHREEAICAYRRAEAINPDAERQRRLEELLARGD